MLCRHTGPTIWRKTNHISSRRKCYSTIAPSSAILSGFSTHWRFYVCKLVEMTPEERELIPTMKYSVKRTLILRTLTNLIKWKESKNGRSIGWSGDYVEDLNNLLAEKPVLHSNSSKLIHTWNYWKIFLHR